MKDTELARQLLEQYYRLEVSGYSLKAPVNHNHDLRKRGGVLTRITVRNYVNFQNRLVPPDMIYISFISELYQVQTVI